MTSDEMVQMHVARVRFDEARRLADLGGIQQDLLFVKEVLTRLADTVDRADADPQAAGIRSPVARRSVQADRRARVDQ